MAFIEETIPLATAQVAPKMSDLPDFRRKWAATLAELKVSDVDDFYLTMVGVGNDRGMRLTKKSIAKIIYRSSIFDAIFPPCNARKFDQIFSLATAKFDAVRNANRGQEALEYQSFIGRKFKIENCLGTLSRVTSLLSQNVNMNEGIPNVPAMAFAPLDNAAGLRSSWVRVSDKDLDLVHLRLTEALTLLLSPKPS